MTLFEQKLVDNGYLKFILNTKTWKYEETDRHFLSTLGNLDHRYFHKDNPIINKIKEGKVVGKDIDWDDRKGEICFGLHQPHTPPTLISPRRNINVGSDEEMQRMLDEKPFEEILKMIVNDI